MVRGFSASRHSFLPLGFGGCGACLEAEAVVSGLKYVTVMRQPVQQCRCHLRITEDACPFAEAEVGLLIFAEN